MRPYVKIDLIDQNHGIIDSNIFKLIREHFSYPKTIFNKKVGKPKTIREYVITNKGQFKIGLLQEIYSFVKKITKNRFDIEVSKAFKGFYEPTFSIKDDSYITSIKGFKYRGIQGEALKRILKRGRGIVNFGTAGGKGLIMAGLSKTIIDANPSQKILIVVPTHLVGKTLEEFDKEYQLGDYISAYSGTYEPDFNKNILIIGSHILTSKCEELENVLKFYNTIIIDECHIIKKTSKIDKIFDIIKTPNIIGLTGTIPLENIDDENRWHLFGRIGKIIHTVSDKNLKDLGLKTKSKIFTVKLEHASPIKFKTYKDEKDYLTLNDARNEPIHILIKNKCRKNTIIPVEYNTQQEFWKSKLEKLNRPLYIVDGDVPDEERLKIFKKLEYEEDAILLCKVGCLREGISIKNLHNLVMPYIGKSFVRIMQMFGRVERLHNDKEYAMIYDFYDNYKYSSQHFLSREDIYKKEKLIYKKFSLAIEK